MATGGNGGPIWSRPEPGARRPRFTRQQISAVALDIADRDGFGAVSMRRVATELGAATMSLYHYVRTKDDLVALMDDALMGEALVPATELSADWRDALTAIARRTRAALVRHPWALAALQDAQFGPNAMRHFEQSLAAVAGTGLDTAARLDLLSIVDCYVFGSALHTGESLQRAAAAQANPEAVSAVIAFGMAQLQTGQFPHIEALLGGTDPRTHPDQAAGPPMDQDSLEQQFERGLQAVLDGVASRLDIPHRL
jgi:AcrR family transcriptional regulator